MSKELTVLPQKRNRLTAAAVKANAALFRALGDETRLEIVGMLAAAGGAMCVCEIEPRFDLSQPTISHHLRLLREAGVVTSERRGTWVYYALDPERIEAIRDFHARLTRS
jgi:ArsR family transcriptional regulator, arsenate/arsenite/antimonite-responsive transcriptional repressor